MLYMLCLCYMLHEYHCNSVKITFNKARMEKYLGEADVVAVQTVVIFRSK